MPCRLQCMLQVSTQVDGNLCCNQKRQLLHHSHVIQSAAALFFCINLTDDGADHKSIACLRIFPDVLAWSGAFLEFTASYVACCFLFSQPILDFVRTRAHRIRNLMVFHCDQQTDSEPTLLLSCLYLLTYIWQMSVVTSCHGSQGTEVGNYQMSWSSGVQSIFCRRRSDRGLRWVGRHETSCRITIFWSAPSFNDHANLCSLWAQPGSPSFASWCSNWGHNCSLCMSSIVYLRLSRISKPSVVVFIYRKREWRDKRLFSYHRVFVTRASNYVWLHLMSNRPD